MNCRKTLRIQPRGACPTLSITQRRRVVGDVLADETGDEVIAVVVTGLDAQLQRMARRPASCLQQLRAQLQPTYLQVMDETGAHEGHAGANAAGFGSHFRVRIACPGFAGKRSVACHRLVYDAVQNLIDQGLHALAIEIVDSP